jgi:hypothetical protein
MWKSRCLSLSGILRNGNRVITLHMVDRKYLTYEKLSHACIIQIRSLNVHLTPKVTVSRMFPGVVAEKPQFYHAKMAKGIS